MNRLLVCLAATCVACSACQKPAPRLNAPPHGEAENKSELQDSYAYMVDNGLLADMSISDVHFLPHRPALNTLGQERLQRLVALMQMYGGTIRFNTNESDQALVDQRMNVVKVALANEGLDTTTEVLKQDLPGGRGMDAAQAILIKTTEGTFVHKKKTSSDAMTPMFPSSGGRK